MQIGDEAMQWRSCCHSARRPHKQQELSATHLPHRTHDHKHKGARAHTNYVCTGLCRLHVRNSRVQPTPAQHVAPHRISSCHHSRARQAMWHAAAGLMHRADSSVYIYYNDIMIIVVPNSCTYIMVADACEQKPKGLPQSPPWFHRCTRSCGEGAQHMGLQPDGSAAFAGSARVETLHCMLRRRLL